MAEPSLLLEPEKTLRPGTYLRLHENKWAAAEEIFITGEMWDPGFNADHRDKRNPGGTWRTRFRSASIESIRVHHHRESRSNQFWETAIREGRLAILGCREKATYSTVNWCWGPYRVVLKRLRMSLPITACSRNCAGCCLRTSPNSFAPD